MKKNDTVIGFLLITIFLVLFTSAAFIWIQDFDKFKSGHGVGYIPTTRAGFITGIYVFYIGLIIFVGYFFESNNFLFRWLMKLCNGGINKKNWPTPLIGIMGIIFGLVGILKSLLGNWK